MFRFLPGVILVQLATAALVFAVLRVPLQSDLLLAIFCMAVVFTLVVAFWFSSIAGNQQREMIQNLQSSHAKETQNLKVNAERQKAKIIKENHKEQIKESRRANSRANLKVSLAFAAAAGVGGLMLFTQFMTVGLLIMGTSGGALAGYLTRARQDQTRLEKTTGDTALVKELNPKPSKFP